MAHRYQLTTELFAIPYREDVYLLYSPLKELLMLANQELVDLVASLREGSFHTVTAENIDAIQLLMEVGAVNGTPDVAPSSEVSARWMPTEVTLFLTNACNLRCTYCYASAGEYKGSLDVDTARSAVDTVVKNALELGRKHIRVSYHGGGEPTLSWEALTRSAEHAEELARRHDLNLHLSIATNGVIPAEKVDWLARHMDDFSISVDGPAWVQDQQRPTVAGRGSYATVEATLRHLDSHNAKYGLRLTVTEQSLPHLEAFVAHLLKRFSPDAIHLEPLFEHGRAKTRGLAAPQAYAFIESYRRAQRVAREFGLDLYYSGARTDLVTDTFCAVPQGSFNVTPEGLLTSCFEVCHPEDELASEFFYGRMEAGAPSVSGAHLEKLAAHTVRERPECENCFCKWHCAGDCIAKNLHADRHSREMKSARCIINQELTRDSLIRNLEQNASVMAQVLAANPGWRDTPLSPLYPAQQVLPNTPAAASGTPRRRLPVIGQRAQ